MKRKPSCLGLLLVLVLIPVLTGLPAAAENESSLVQDNKQAAGETLAGKRSKFATRFATTSSPLLSPTKVGRSVPEFEAMAGPTLKGTVYCLALILLLFGAYKRLKGSNAAGLDPQLIEVLGRRQLGSRLALLVVQADGKKFFLAQSDNDISLLAELDLPSGFEETIRFSDANPIPNRPAALASAKG